jgi:hypothetical protein
MDEDKKVIQHYLFMRFSQLNAEEFLKVAKLILSSDPRGKKVIEDMVRDITIELRDQEAKQALGDEDEDDLDDIDISSLF